MKGQKFTALQGQYLAYIHTYTLLHRQPPAEADMQEFFQVTPPSVHNMVLTLESRRLIERVPGKPRSIRVLIPTNELPGLEQPPPRRDMRARYPVLMLPDNNQLHLTAPLGAAMAPLEAAPRARSRSHRRRR